MKPVSKVIAIGDSFLAGTELADPTQTWPGLYATHRDLEYECLARPARTSQFVLRQLFDSLQRESSPCFYMIHWPSAIRYEYVDRDRDVWVQITPHDIHDGGKHSSEVRSCYYANVNSYLGDKWHNLLMIYAAVQALTSTDHRFAMTTVDDFLYDSTFHNPGYVDFLQQHTRDHILDFQGHTFTKWAQIHNFPHGAYKHPLEQAHCAAFDLMRSRLDQIAS